MSNNSNKNSDKKKSFHDLGLSETLVKTIKSEGYTSPTPIQEQAIPKVLMGRDILGVAQTGTGKTASFLLPLIDILSHQKTKSRMAKVVILSPTRELASQIADNFKVYAKGTGFEYALLIGGGQMAAQSKSLEDGVEFIIATPGRFIDMFDRGKMMLHSVDFFVIDEADRMLDMGFIPDIEKISKVISQPRQTLLFSATMPDAMRDLSKKFLKDPREITIEPDRKTAENVDQYYLYAKSKGQKFDLLNKLLSRENPDAVIIFCNRKSTIPEVKKFLKSQGRDGDSLHGDLTQRTRKSRLEKFNNGDYDLLICSDLAARGIDVSRVSHVVNFDVPQNPEDYVHRIGRTGRAGRSGKAHTIIEGRDKDDFGKIQKLVEVDIPEDSLTRRGSSSSKSNSNSKNDYSKSKNKSNNGNNKNNRRNTSPKTDNNSGSSEKGFAGDPPAFLRRGV